MPGCLLDRGLQALEATGHGPVEVRRVLLAYPERVVAEASYGGPRGDPVRAAVKVADPANDAPGCDLAAELAALRAVAAAGVPVPEVLASVLDGSLSVLVTRWADGVPLDRAGDPATAWRAAGATVRAVHRATAPEPGAPGPGVPGPTGPADRAAAWARRMRTWTGAACDRAARDGYLPPGDLDRWRARLLTAVANPPPVLALLHGDCQPDHVLLDAAGRVRAVLDLGDAGVGDPAYDLAVLTLNHPEHLDDVLAGYAADPVWEAYARIRLPAYQALRRLGSVAWLADHAYPVEAELAALRTLAAG